MASEKTYTFESEGIEVSLTVRVTTDLLDLRREDRMFLNTLMDTVETWRKKAHDIRFEPAEQSRAHP